MPLVYVAMVLFLVLSLAIDRVMLLRYCATPRYTGKLSALLLLSCPSAWCCTSVSPRGSTVTATHPRTSSAEGDGLVP